MMIFKKNSKIGDVVYPIRTTGYIFGLVTLLLYRYDIGQIDLFNIITFIIFFIYPHLAFFFYKRNYSANLEFGYFIFDALLIGLFAAQMHFSIVPVSAFLIVCLSTAMGIRGFKLFSLCLISFVSGVLAGGYMEVFSFESQPSTSVILISFVYLLIGTVGHNYFNYIRSLKFIEAKEKIKSQNIEIEKNLEEKDILLKEIHHRVKNNLQVITSLLNLQLEKITDSKAKQALNTAQSRIKTMSLLHQELYKSDNIEYIDTPDYLNQLVDYIQKMQLNPKQEVRVETNIEAVKITLNYAIPLGLILNEIVSNSFEHAFGQNNTECKIWINIYKENNCLVAEIGDNGNGKSSTGSQDDTLGYLLIRDMIRQLKGSISLTTNNGYVYQFKIPLE